VFSLSSASRHCTARHSRAHICKHGNLPRCNEDRARRRLIPAELHSQCFLLQSAGRVLLISPPSALQPRQNLISRRRFLRGNPPSPASSLSPTNPNQLAIARHILDIYISPAYPDQSRHPRTKLELNFRAIRLLAAIAGGTCGRPDSELRGDESRGGSAPLSPPIAKPTPPLPLPPPLPPT